MKNIEEFKKLRNRWNCFSKVDILGSFDFYTLTISLDSISPHDIKDLSIEQLSDNRKHPLTMTDYEILKKVIPLAVHEFTHYLDGTATLWGIEHLNRINNASEVLPTEEKEFYRLKSLYDHVRRLRLPNYYTTIEKDTNESRPWALHMTSGREFSSDGYISDRPIIFGRFFNSERQALVRSPISILSLLETSAMAEELTARISLIKQLGAEGIVEEKIISNEMLDYIYNPNLTEYSVCTHLVANSTNCQDIYASFQMSAFIVRLILNFSAHEFDAAKKNLSNWANSMGVSKESSEIIALRHALGHKNHGALYYMLAVTLPRNPQGNPTLFSNGLNNSLQLLGINLNKSLEISKKEYFKIAKQLEKSNLITLSTIAKSAAENFNILKDPPFTRPIEKLHLPPVFLNDMSQHQFKTKGNSLQEFDLEKSYDELIKIQLRVENLAEACI
jgi:hypothetical protein